MPPARRRRPAPSTGRLPGTAAGPCGVAASATATSPRATPPRASVSRRRSRTPSTSAASDSGDAEAGRPAGLHHEQGQRPDGDDGQQEAPRHEQETAQIARVAGPARPSPAEVGTPGPGHRGRLEHGGRAVAERGSGDGQDGEQHRDLVPVRRDRRIPDRFPVRQCVLDSERVASVAVPESSARHRFADVTQPPGGGLEVVVRRLPLYALGAFVLVTALTSVLAWTTYRTVGATSWPGRSWTVPAGSMHGSRATRAGTTRSPSQGYSYTPGQQSSIAFFPVYPLLVRGLGWLLGGDFSTAAGLLTLVCAAGVVMLFADWVRSRVAPRTAVVAVALLLVYPYSFFLYGSGYSDASYLLSVLGAFALLERRHYVLAATVGALATAGRPVGVAVAVGLVVRAARADRPGPGRAPGGRARRRSGAAVGTGRPELRPSGPGRCRSGSWCVPSGSCAGARPPS